MVKLTGYHGTEKNKGEIILSTKEFIPAGDFRSWLGKGVYFFENDKHQAYMFAKFKNRDNILAHEDICVIEASLKGNNCIDLLCDDDRKFLKEYSKKIEKKNKEKKGKVGNWRHKEGFILDFLYNSGNKYDLVKAAYIPPKRRSDVILEYLPIQIQICVKNVSCIDKDSISEVNCDAYERV